MESGDGANHEPSRKYTFGRCRDYWRSIAFLITRFSVPHLNRKARGGYSPKGVTPGVAINYGGNASTISQNKGIPIEQATEIYNNYLEGFSGLKAYQSFRRKDWMDKGYIILNPKTGHKAFIPDGEQMKETAESMKVEGFWKHYREMKQSDPKSYTVQKVKEYSKKKSDYERASINYPIRLMGRG